jgi:hypothetical protein
MAGAILGAVSNTDPPEKVYDFDYFENEAERLYELSQGQRTESFHYPDMLYWQPPESQIDTLGQYEGKWILQGLGQASPVGTPIGKRNKSPIIWQWFKLNFGQTILARRRTNANLVSEKALPVSQIIDETSEKSKRIRSVPGKETKSYQQPSLWENIASTDTIEKKLTVDSAVAIAIKSRLKDNVVGSLLLQLSDQEDGIHKAVTFAEIIAKARAARLK